MRRIYRQGFDARAAFRRMTVLTPAPEDTSAPAPASPPPTEAPPPQRIRVRRRIVAFAGRVARAIFRRAKPFLGPLAFRGRRYLFTEQASQLEAMHRALDEGRLMTATWANEEQGKLAVRLVTEVQASRRMLSDRLAHAHAVQTDAIASLARDVAAIRGLLGAEAVDGLHAVLDVALLPGAAFAYVGAPVGSTLELAQRKVGAHGSVTVVGPGTALDGLFAEATVDVLRIDAPGHEAAVLQGACRSLAHHAGVRIIVRFDGAAVRRGGVSATDWLAIFTDKGFQPLPSPRGDGPLHGTTAASLEHVEFCELLFSRTRP